MPKVKQGYVSAIFEIELGQDTKVLQRVHGSYLKGQGDELDADVERYIIALRKALLCARSSDTSLFHGEARLSDTELALRARMRAMARVTMPVLRRQLIAIEDGTFSFRCSKAGECSRYPSADGGCPTDGDIRERMIALPAACSCADWAEGKIS